MKWFLTIILIVCVSCGQSTEEEIRDAIEEANLLLSSRRCDEALEVLNGVGLQNRNKDYLDSLATAYACKGNYSSTTLFASDFPNLNTSSNTLYGSLAAFSTSGDMTSATDNEFTNLQTAIDTLLYAGGITSASAASRADFFTGTEATDINLQAFYMILVNMGRWFRYYGNTNSSGVKGQGSGSNTCLYTYTDADAINVISLGGTGSCTNLANVGRTDMTKERLCQGIVLLNNFIDTISSISFTGSNSDTLNAVKGEFIAACTTAAGQVDSFSSTMCSVRDLATCTEQTDENVEKFAVLLLETLLQ